MSDTTVFISANTAWNLFSRKRLLLAMKEAGWKVICLANPDQNAGRFETELGISFIPLPMKADGTSIREDLGLFFRYFRLYRKHKPAAVLHINNKPNIYGTIAASLLGIHSASNVTGLGVVAEKKGLTKTFVYALYRIAFSSRKAFVFFQNREDRQFFLDNRLVDGARTAVLPGSGVDCGLFAPDPHFRPKEKDMPVTFLFSGRLLITKGIREFIGAARDVRALYSEACFNIIGEYDPSNPIFIAQGELEAAVTSGIVRYFGSVPDVKPYVNESDCVVLPSFYREGVPRALLEAAATGKPLIVADSIGTRDPVENGINGYRVIPGDRKSLADAMIAFMRSTATAKGCMGTESRRIAETRFSDTIIIEAYLKRLAAFGKELS